MKLTLFLHNVEDCVKRMWFIIKITLFEMWDSLWKCITLNDINKYYNEFKEIKL